MLVQVNLYYFIFPSILKTNLGSVLLIPFSLWQLMISSFVFVPTRQGSQPSTNNVTRGSCFTNTGKRYACHEARRAQWKRIRSLLCHAMRVASGEKQQLFSNRNQTHRTNGLIATKVSRGVQMNRRLAMRRSFLPSTACPINVVAAFLLVSSSYPHQIVRGLRRRVLPSHTLFEQNPGLTENNHPEY